MLKDLSTAEVGDELSPLLFDRTEYTPFEEFVAAIQGAEDRKVSVSNRSLSVHGRVVKDSMDRYLGHEGLSSSALKEALKTPLHFFHYLQGTFRPKNTDHFELGTFAHMAFLEPRRFDRVVMEPNYGRNTNEGLIKLIQFYQNLMHLPEDCLLSKLKQKVLRDKLADLEQRCDYLIVDQSDMMIINAVKRGYNSYGGGVLPRLFKNAKSEVSMYLTDFSTGQKVKIRPDAMVLEEDFGVNAIISLKTTSADTVEQFMADSAKYRYELSEGMYLDVASQTTGRQFTATIMVMLQTVIPFQIAVFYWDAEDLEVGKYKYRQALDIVRECEQKRSYTGFECKAEQGCSGIIQMKLPDWIKRELPPMYIER